MSSWITPPECGATGIGGLPHTDPRQACDDVLEAFPKFPYVPTLPNRGLMESIVFCDSTSLPGGIVHDGRLGIDPSRDAGSEMEKIYLDFMEKNVAPYARTDRNASAFFEMAKRDFSSAAILKCQVTGPVTFGMQVVDADRRPLYYDDQYADVISKMIALIARWCEEAMRQFSGVKETLVVLNEPYLASLGSSVVPIRQENVTAGWEDIAGMVEGGLGVHCCANTDWSYLMGLNPSFLSFDAFTCSRELLLYMDDLVAFMERGGVVAWGLIPARPEDFSKVTPDTFFQQFSAIRQQVADSCSDELFMKQSVVTPTCGIQTGEPSQAREIMGAAATLSDRARAGRSG